MLVCFEEFLELRTQALVDRNDGPARNGHDGSPRSNIARCFDSDLPAFEFHWNFDAFKVCSVVFEPAQQILKIS